MAHLLDDHPCFARSPLTTPTEVPSAHMSRSLVFVERRADIVTSHPKALLIVLDPAWTPAPGDPPEIRPVRDLFAGIVQRHNLFDESLALLDAWAVAAGAADRFSSGGVTWWFHARSFLRLDVHEMLVWHHVLEDLAAEGPFDRIAVPSRRRALLAVARATAAAGGIAVVTQREFVPLRVLVEDLARPVLDVLLKIRRHGRRIVDPRFARRAGQLSRRIDALASEPGSILALVRALSFHVIDDGAGSARDDPYVAPVLRRLDAGRPVVRVAIGLDHRRIADWGAISGDEHLVPFSMVEHRFPPSASERREAAMVASGIAGLRRIPLLVGGVDLGPAFTKRVAGQARWFTRQRLAMGSAERFMVHLGVTVVFTGWESARTSWLGAASRSGIPSVAVQHGVIYHNTPDYCRPAHPALVKPDVTCVFGEYERELLIREGRYDPGAVVATGSPRSDPRKASTPMSPDERASTRRALGIADGDRVLVVSTARHAVGDEIHSMAMVGRLLDGPLPGVHVIFKLHPEEQVHDHYGELLAGLARAGGYAPPRVSMIRDIDVYRLLRIADAHLGQYSTVLTDAVLTGTPNMIAVGQAWADVIGYVDAGVATPVTSVDDVRAFMSDPRPATPEARDRFLEAHYRDGDAASRIADVISQVAGR